VDHVIARSWFPKSATPVEKWKAPACFRCNNTLSKAEKTLLGRLAFSLPKNGIYQQIVEAAFRAIEPRAAKNARDERHRTWQRKRVAEAIVRVPAPHLQGIIPSSRKNFSLGSRTGVLIPADALDLVVEKWVRGIHFCEHGWIAPKDAKVQVGIYEPNVHRAVFSELKSTQLVRGPGVSVRIAHAEEIDDFITIYEFNLWDRFLALAVIEGQSRREPPPN
jgi:hypothetical protein